MSLTAAQIIRHLDLVPHPTCGFVRQSFRSSIALSDAALPKEFTRTTAGGPRVLGDAMYFLVAPPATMKLHRIRSDQTYHHYLGDPLEVLLFLPNGTFEVRTVGSDLSGGMLPQLFIPGGTFHVSRLRDGGTYALLATTVWISVDPVDVEPGDASKLSAAYPGSEQVLRRFVTA